MRKIRMTSRTSISGMKLISGASRERPARRFISSALLPLAVRELDQLDRLLSHLQRQAVDLRPEMPIEDHAWNGHDQAEGRVIERHRDAVRELDRIRAGRALRAEDLDHADDRAEKAKEGRHGGDRAERGEKALEIVRHQVTHLLDRLFHYGPRTLRIP